jgi:hypothetical protein
LGELPLSNLANLGRTYEREYANHSGGQITQIKDLSECDAQELTDQTGIPLGYTIDHVKRAQLVCSQIRLNRMHFGELFDKTIYEIAHMTNAEILNYDAPEDDPETQGDVDELRENIALLYICLDDVVLQNLTFGDIIRNQPEAYFS